jgi:type I restriction enzyme, S subunit
MSEWQEYKLGDVSDRIGMGPFGSNIKVSTFVSEGIPVISGTHLRGIKLEDKEYNFITVEHANKLQSANVCRGDVIFTHAGNIGQVAFIPSNSKFERYILSQRQFFLRCKKDALIPEFLTYYFKSNEGQYQLLANANQTGVPSLAQPVSYLKTIRIFLPPLPEQSAIAGVLSSLDDKIDLLQRQNKTLEGMAEALWRKIFVEDADPGWKKGKLGDYITVKGGTTPSTKNPEYWNGDICWTSPRDLSGNNQVFLHDTERKITLSGLNQIGSGLLPIGSVLLSSRAPIGYLTISNISVAINQGYIAVICDGLFSNYYMYLWIKANLELIIGSANGSTFLEISKSTFKDLEIEVPTESSVRSFNLSIKPMFDKILANEKQIRTLSRLRDTLLPKLMSGEVRVKLNN